MCGILAAFGTKDYELAIEQSGKLGHRGQMREGSRFSIMDKGGILCHERLSIIDLHTGKQPIQGSDEKNLDGAQR